MPWIWRLLIAIAILAAPIITFWAFTDPESADPTRDQRLRDARDPQLRRPPAENSNPPTPYDSRP
jgi:hypothetical protein